MEKASGMRKDGEMAGGKMAKWLVERWRNCWEKDGEMSLRKDSGNRNWKI